jgi:ribosomal protein L37E
MFSLKDVLEILDRWPSWKKIQATPEQLDLLEKRVAQLESRLARCPGESCPHCGDLSFRVASSSPQPGHLGKLGLIVRQMKCEKCGFAESRTIPPSQQ